MFCAEHNLEFVANEMFEIIHEALNPNDEHNHIMII